MGKHYKRVCAWEGFLLGLLLLSGCRAGMTGGTGDGQQNAGNDAQLSEQTTEYVAKETEEEKIRPANAILPELPELSGAFTDILTGSADGVFLGYPVDESFLLWIAYQYGEDTVDRLAECITEENAGSEIWFNLTGSTIHVLWLEYCRDLNYSSYLLKNVTWVDCADKNEFTMDFIGDVNFSEGWYTTRALDERGGNLESCISGEILDELRSADVAMANNEFTFSTGGSAVEGKAYVFRADPSRVSYYKDMGVDIVSLANNHAWDYGREAFLDTMDTLNDAGITYVGAGKDIDEAAKIQYFVANGRKIAIVSATQIERYNNYTQEAEAGQPGVLKMLEPELFVNVIREAKMCSDYVIAYVHWGTEGSLYPEADVKSLAAQFVDAGADAVIGGHAHRLQGMTFIDDSPVVYSMGNFWFSTGDLYTTIIRMKINAFGELTVSYLPCEQKDLTVLLLTDEEEVDGFYKYVADLSTRVGFDANGTAYNRAQKVDKVQLKYLSGVDYEIRYDGIDLESNGIDIVGNVK